VPINADYYCRLAARRSDLRLYLRLELEGGAYAERQHASPILTAARGGFTARHAACMHVLHKQSPILSDEVRVPLSF